MERIASFTVNHDVLTPGLYLSRRDGHVTTFDLRFKKPNTGALLRQVFAQGVAWDATMPGKSSRECGNYINLDTALARDCCAFYAALIADWTPEQLTYPE